MVLNIFSQKPDDPNKKLRKEIQKHFAEEMKDLKKKKGGSFFSQKPDDPNKKLRKEIQKHFAEEMKDLKKKKGGKVTTQLPELSYGLPDNQLHTINGTTKAFKILSKYFGLINNDEHFNYGDDIVEWLKIQFNGLNSRHDTTADELLCISMLCIILDIAPPIYTITMKSMISLLKRKWPHRGYEKMIKTGLDNNWTREEMLGQLWSLYRGIIDG